MLRNNGKAFLVSDRKAFNLFFVFSKLSVHTLNNKVFSFIILYICVDNKKVYWGVYLQKNKERGAKAWKKLK